MWDAYTGQKLRAKCQVTPWDTPRRDGMTTIRRTLFVKAGTVFPYRGAVVVAGQVWIISRLNNPDTWGENIAREGYVAQYARVGRLADTQAMIDNTGYPLYLSRVWVKDVKDITTTSEAQGQYYIYFTHAEPVKVGGFILSDDRWHIVRNIINGTAGLRVAECNELEEDCIVDVAIHLAGEYDPVSETYTDSERVNFKSILMNWRDDYYHSMPSREPEQVGDMRLRIPPEHTDLVTEDTRLHLKGYEWKVVESRLHEDGSESAVIRRI
ncbi:hypothetical protein CRG49_000605 [Neisseria sp. N95_16]|nr:hypothetical protein CRG49_000605 [Neisseria sp. N95_16]